MAVGSPLLLMIVFFMGDFKRVTLDRAMYKPLCSFWYVNDACVIWLPWTTEAEGHLLAVH
jgi:hypothetical protein